MWYKESTMPASSRLYLLLGLFLQSTICDAAIVDFISAYHFEVLERVVHIICVVYF